MYLFCTPPGKSEDVHMAWCKGRIGVTASNIRRQGTAAERDAVCFHGEPNGTTARVRNWSRAWIYFPLPVNRHLADNILHSGWIRVYAGMRMLSNATNSLRVSFHNRDGTDTWGGGGLQGSSHLVLCLSIPFCWPPSPKPLVEQRWGVTLLRSPPDPCPTVPRVPPPCSLWDLKASAWAAEKFTQTTTLWSHDPWSADLPLLADGVLRDQTVVTDGRTSFFFFFYEN